MDASILDLRYKMRDVLGALNRQERVTIRYHGKIKGEIVPVANGGRQKSREHPMFGMNSAGSGDPAAEVSAMRRARNNDL